PENATPSEKAKTAREIALKIQELMEVARQCNLPVMEDLLASALAETAAIEQAERENGVQ
ncbi:hypothetical protein J8J27_31085, partial [Mycobacterium tuberculosis]|nr:hypothetical protein [Mycobacterium tuberculosis]